MMYRISPLLLLCLWVAGSASLLLDRTFFVMWNIPTDSCPKFGIDLLLSKYGIQHNKGFKVIGEKIAKLNLQYHGKFPYYSDGIAIKGGVPQNASINNHLDALMADIKKSIPGGCHGFNGLAMFEWKGWRPLWVQNHMRLQVYKEASQSLVRKEHPDWTPDKVETEAKKNFEAAAQVFMEKNIRTAQNLNHNALWGYHGLPPCFNYQYKIRSVQYTGACPKVVMENNDQLSWLWKALSAFYPGIYLDTWLSGTGNTISLYSRNRIQEAQRLAQMESLTHIPIIVCGGISYTRSLEFLTREELEYTIGESAAMGAHAMVLGEDGTFVITKESCRAIRDHVNGTLGNYVLNVTLAALLCSEVLCSGQGRCQRLSSAPTAYLNLPNSFRPASYDPDVVKQWAKDNKGGTTAESVYIKKLATQFGCACFSAWKGKSCNEAVK